MRRVITIPDDVDADFVAAMSARLEQLGQFTPTPGLPPREAFAERAAAAYRTVLTNHIMPWVVLHRGKASAEAHAAVVRQAQQRMNADIAATQHSRDRATAKAAIERAIASGQARVE